MRFIVDESTGLTVVGFLRAAGHDVLAIGENMPQAADQEVLLRAASEERILITNDKDFGELIFRSGQAHYGVLLMRLHDESAANRLRVISSVLDKFSDRLQGNFVVATEKGIRIRAAR